MMNKLNLLGAFAVGFVTASLLFAVVIIPKVAQDKYEFGTHQGFTDGFVKAAKLIENEFGTYDRQSPCTRLFSAKDIDVVSVEVDGVKTIRVSW